MLRFSRRVAACLLILASAQAAVDVSPASAPRMEFTPLAPGTYQFLCYQRGHADKGQTGTLTVTAAPGR